MSTEKDAIALIPAIHTEVNSGLIDPVAPHELAKRKVTRERIYALQDSLEELIDTKQVEKEMGTLKHYFIPGVYARELFIPAGTVMVSKLHKFPRLCMILQGEVSFTTEYGSQRVKAPYTAEFIPGSKVALYTHTDVIWTAIFGTDETDVNTIEDFLTVKDHIEYDEYCKSLGLNEGEELCLSQQ